MRRFPFFEPSLTRSLRGLQLRPRHPAEGQIVGLHRSRHRGFSVEFAEHRPYTPGDDLRYLDWKVFGRTDKPYVRQFEDERELACYLVLDTSGSMGYRGDERRTSKLAWSRTPLALLAWLALGQRDAVALLTFDQRLHWRCGPTSHPSQLERICLQLEALRAEGKTDTGRALRALGARLQRRGLVVLVSDLLSNVESLFAGLSRLVAAGHEIWILHVMDPNELEFPFRGQLLFRGLESEAPIAVDAEDLRPLYIEAMSKRLERIETLCRRRGIVYQRALNDSPPTTALRPLLSPAGH